MSETAKNIDLPPSGEDTEVQDASSREVSQGLSLRTLQTPGAIPGYQIEQCLGEGSYGSVWLAREVRTGKKVAIKFYARGRGVDWSLLSREVEKLAVLYTSRNIVRLIDVAWDHDPPYFVMEYLENGSLAQKLEQGSLPVEDAVRITRAMAQALVHAHGSGVLHCDLKPANVLFDASGDARLCDFGQSRLSTERTPSLGTLFYMAPEQAVLDGIPDARWDVYALGALLYQMLTGTAPRRNVGSEQTLQRATTTEERLAAYRRLLEESPRPVSHRSVSGVDQRLAEIVDSCLERDPQLRLANAQIVLDLLDQRDRAKSRRPLLILALLGPLLFLAAMFWIAESAVPRVVQSAEDNLASRALAGDSTSARILALSIHQEIVTRTEELESEARSSHVQKIIAGSKDLNAEQLRDLCRGTAGPPELADSYRKLNQAKEGDGDRHPDRSWFLTDVEGRQIFRNPVSEDLKESTIGKFFNRRDYFHGKGKDIVDPIPKGSISPRKTPGVSAAYTSEATGQYAIAIAVPVWNEEKTEVIGVLGRSLHLPDLLDRWEKPLHDDATGADQRFLALAQIDSEDDSLFLLDHNWMNPANMKSHMERGSKSKEPRIRISTEQSQHLLQERSTATYIDPIAKLDPRFDGEWLAASYPVEDSKWIAIVQERRDIALKPMEDLRHLFYRSGYFAITIFSVMLGVFWVLLRRASE